MVGHVRLDVDPGFDDQNGSYSIDDALVRNHAGDILVAQVANIRRPETVLGGELSALLIGLRLCKMFSLQNVDVYSDSSVAVSAVTSEEVYFGYEGILIDLIKSLISDSSFRGIWQAPRQALQ